MNDPRQREHLPELVLQGARTGALPEPQRAQALAHLEACPACKAELQEIERIEQVFTSEVFPRTVANLAHKASPGSRWRRFWLPSLAGVLLPAAAAYLLWLQAAPSPRQAPASAVPAIRSKGEPGFKAFAARGGQVFLVEDGKSLLEPGDQIRFVVRPAGLPYVLVASVDGGAEATVYYPYDGEQSAPVPPDRGEVALDGSIRLDDQLGPERVFVLQSRQPIAAEAVRRALRLVARGGPGAVRSTFRLPVGADAQSSLLFEKTTRTRRSGRQD